MSSTEKKPTVSSKDALLEKESSDKLNSGFASTISLDPRDVIVDKTLLEEGDDAFYEVVDIEDMEFEDASQAFYYYCPCGDRFSLSIEDIEDGEEIAHCPSCTLKIRVRYNPDDFFGSGDESDE